MPAYGYAHSMKPDFGLLTEPLSLVKVNRDRPIVGIRVTRFRDGTVVGLSNAHALMDGVGAWRLLERWAKHYRGDPSGQPLSYNRQPLLQEEGPIAAPDPRLDTPLSRRLLAGFVARSLLTPWTAATALVHLPGALLGAWKADLMGQVPGGEWISTQDAVMGVLVQALATTSVNRRMEIGTIYDLRRLPELGLSPHYVGNAATARALNEETAVLARSPLTLARSLRRLAATVTSERILADLRAIQARVAPSEALRYMPSFIRRQFADGLLLNNYSRFPIYRVDFGRGPPRWGDYPRLPLNRVITVCPDPQGDGAAVHLTLPRAELRRLILPSGVASLHVVGRR